MMQFLIDGHRDRVLQRWQTWPELIKGQLLTPLTRYSLNRNFNYAVDNGCFSGFDEEKQKRFVNLLKRDFDFKEFCLFVCTPDVLGCHKSTVEFWHRYKHLSDGYRKAFVLQDGCDWFPDDCYAVFLGGSTQFKDSDYALQLCEYALSCGKHLHIGRVNGFDRYMRFNAIGAHTCDGSGLSRYDHMIDVLKQKWDEHHES